MKEWGFPYGNWPSDLKDEYAYNSSMANNLLADAGFPNGFKTNIIANAAQPADILMRIKHYFAAVRIDMEIKTMDSVSYTANLTNRIYDQMVDNTNEERLGMVNEPLYHLQRFQTGFKANCPLVSDPVFDAFYPNSHCIYQRRSVKNCVKKCE